MFFRRRHHRHGLLHLILLLLGFKVARRCCKETDPEKREELKAKGRLFRSKLKEAFGVWTEDEKKAEGDSPAEQQG